MSSAPSTESRHEHRSTITSLSLEAKSPFELRVDQSSGLEEAVKEAAQTGEVGFLHSFTTARLSMGRGPRCCLTAGCQLRCLYATTPTRGPG
jgi:hypothetical protein